MDAPNAGLYKTNSSWLPYRGSTVVLVESDEPWYINKDISTPMKVIRKNTDLNKSFYDYAMFKTDSGNSLVESFNKKQSDVEPLVLLLCLLIIIVIIRRIM